VNLAVTDGGATFDKGDRDHRVWLAFCALTLDEAQQDIARVAGVMRPYAAARGSVLAINV